mgnify:CR=1 FL=1
MTNMSTRCNSIAQLRWITCPRAIQKTCQLLASALSKDVSMCTITDRVEWCAQITKTAIWVSNSPLPVMLILMLQPKIKGIQIVKILLHTQLEMQYWVQRSKKIPLFSKLRSKFTAMARDHASLNTQRMHFRVPKARFSMSPNLFKDKKANSIWDPNKRHRLNSYKGIKITISH